MNIKIANQFNVVEDLVELLNKKRNESIPNATKMIESCLSQLGMPYAKFNIIFEKCDSFHQNGNTNVSFCFSANKGGMLLELSKVASGGELSRLMLAIKFISSKYSNLGTLIFDEIDSGVSGEIASLMGEMMKKMGESTQVLAISHLPQIASKGERHLKMIKTVVNSETISNIITLNNNERVEEIAKLLSGKGITEAAFDNARALLHQ
jgi:DNA repair protein RecN (Recombination protein N)